jgi:hypothetical protein
MKQEIPVAMAKRLRSNLVLRMVLAAAFVVLWASPVVLHLMSGNAFSLGEIYGASWTGFSSGSLALLAGYLTLLFTRNRLRRELAGKDETPVAASTAATPVAGN